MAGLVVLAVSGTAFTADGEAHLGREAAAIRVDEDGQFASHRAYLRRTAEALARSDTPRELALAAWLRQTAEAMPPPPDAEYGRRTMYTAPDPVANAWRRRAAQSAGDDVIANMLLVAGARRPDAISQTAARRWADAEPHNIAPLLLTDAPIGIQLEAAARRPHYDSGFYSTVRWIRDALVAHPADTLTRAHFAGNHALTPPVHATMLATTLWVGGQTAPRLARINAACTPGRMDTVRRSHCETLASRLQSSDAALTRLLGTALGSRLAVHEDEVAAIESLRRDTAWRTHALQLARQGDGVLQFDRLLDDASLLTELQLQDRMLADAGLPVTPPAGWTPPAI